MHKKITAIVVLTLAILTLAFVFPIQAKIIFRGSNQSFSNIEIPFIVNQGQVDDRIIAYAQTFGGKVYIEKNGKIVYSLNGDDQRSFILEEIAVKAVCNGITFENKAPTKINYFKGYYRSNWHSNIPSYSVINLGELYDGITLKLKAYGNNIEKLFYIAPGADPDNIRLKINEAENLCINNSGELEVLTEYGIILFTKPTAYQIIQGTKKCIDVEYSIDADTYGFRVDSYNPDYELIIDPLLVSTYLGGSDIEGWEYSGVIDNATDTEGNILVAGMTESVDFPYIEGHYECDTRGNADLFIAKFDENLAQLLAVTVIGGNADERYPRITVGENGNIYLLGQSFSANYPTTAESFSQSYFGNGDIVISRFDQELTTLTASTYIGGAGLEDFPALDLDDSDHVFISGVTSHDSYPTIEGSYRTYIAGSSEYFISKLESDLSTLIASTFIGGQYQERHLGMMIAPSGEVVLVGTTASPDYPTTANAFDTTFNGLPPYSEYNNDAVVSKFDNGLTTLLASTFIGAEDYEGGIIIAIDTSGSIFFGGHTTSADYPTTPGAFDEGHNGINEFFITKMSYDLTAMEASTFLTPDESGPDGFIFINDLIIDMRNRLIMVGAAWDTCLYTTENAYDRSFNGGLNDLGIMVMTDDLTMVEYATYLGGSGNEGDAAVANGNGRNFYIAAYSSSTDFPIFPGTWQPAHAGGEKDCIVAKLTADQFTRITDGPQVNDGGWTFGVSWVDYDGDGYPDLHINNWVYNSDEAVNYLYHNNGDGTYSLTSDEEIIGDGGSTSSTWGDYDNDGDLDAYVSCPQKLNYFYTNDGDGTFTKATSGPLGNLQEITEEASWVDYDNDDDLDLFVANHLFPGDPYIIICALYRNDSGSFTMLDNSSIGLIEDEGGSIAWCDYDNDGDLDVMWSRNEKIAVFFDNDGDGTFTQITDNEIVRMPRKYHFSPADYDNDGDLDIYTNADYPGPPYLCKNTGDGDFELVTGQDIAVDYGYWTGGYWGDYDNDGYQDLFITGHYYYEPYPNRLYHNEGDGTFTRILTGVVATDIEPTSAVAWADHDRDGDLDLFAVNVNNVNNVLYINNGNANAWIQITLVGTNSNRSAIGAKIRLKATINGEPVWQLREISARGGFFVQNSLTAHFGLGDAAIIDSIKIEWPSGMVDVYTDVAPNQFITYTETVCGDADGNFNVNLLDITYLISYLYKDGPAPQHMQAADPDGNGTTNLLDITYLIAYLYKSGTKPVCL